MDHFTGRARVDPLFSGDEDINAAGAPGRPVQEIRPGDVVWCPPGAKHWHGAAPTIAMTHLAVTGSVDGKSAAWMEKVTDAQYNAAGAVAPREQETMTIEQTLSARQQTIPPIAAFTATGNMPELNTALNQGLDAGLIISETKEILLQLYASVGFPRSLNALGELMNVVEARKQRGIQDAPGREPSRAIPGSDALVAIGTANQTKSLARRSRGRSSTSRRSSSVFAG